MRPGGSRASCDAARRRRTERLTPWPNSLQATAISKTFGGLAAVSGVDLSVDEGEIHCLIGPNGAGKSTFFKLIVGTYAPTAGSIAFRGDEHHRHAAIRPRAPRHEHQDADAERVQGIAGAPEHPHRPSAPRLQGRSPARRRPPAGPHGAIRRCEQAGGNTGPRTAAMARNRHGAGLEADLAVDGRADRRHVDRGDFSHRRVDQVAERTRA